MISQGEKELLSQFGLAPAARGIPRGAFKNPYRVEMKRVNGAVRWIVKRYDFKANLDENRPLRSITRYVSVNTFISKLDAERFVQLANEKYRNGTLKF